MAMESSWKDDQLISSVAWKPNGQKCPDTNVQDRAGIIVRYYEDGKKEFRNTYKDGRLNGLSTGWYKNGQRKSESNTKDGKWEGLRTNWYENGQKEDESSFKEGKRDGFWIKYNIDGNEIFRKTYKNGEEVKDFRFDPQLLPPNLQEP
jgi:antitoxin component YwqK of YwqJK toxin-antitoxin module